MWTPAEAPDFLVELTNIVSGICGHLNIYVDGKKSVAWHPDKEELFDTESGETIIVSLSLGQERVFQHRLFDDEKSKKEVTLSDGDLLIMSGLTQRHYEHQVPKLMGSRVRSRINLT